jgi:hypothetical protein
MYNDLPNISGTEYCKSLCTKFLPQWEAWTMVLAKSEAAFCLLTWMSLWLHQNFQFQLVKQPTNYYNFRPGNMWGKGSNNLPCWLFPDIVSIPSTTLPKTTCFPSNSEQSPKEMKNCVPAYHSKQNCSGMHKFAPIYCQLQYVQILKAIHLDVKHNNDTWQLPCVLENIDYKDQCNQCGCNLLSSKRSRSSWLCTVIIIARSEIMKQNRTRY